MEQQDDNDNDRLKVQQAEEEDDEEDGRVSQEKAYNHCSYINHLDRVRVKNIGEGSQPSCLLNFSAAMFIYFR